jgi:hypothetical protein
VNIRHPPLKKQEIKKMRKQVIGRKRPLISARKGCEALISGIELNLAQGNPFVK